MPLRSDHGIPSRGAFYVIPGLDICILDVGGLHDVNRINEVQSKESVKLVEVGKQALIPCVGERTFSPTAPTQVLAVRRVLSHRNYTRSVQVSSRTPCAARVPCEALRRSVTPLLRPVHLTCSTGGNSHRRAGELRQARKMWKHQPWGAEPHCQHNHRTRLLI